ncbi:MAG: S8 family serine peptidase [Candidatus Hydrothermales bacterium]
MKKFLYFFILGILSGEENLNHINISRYSFDPLIEDPLPSYLKIKETETEYFIIQFKGPIKRENIEFLNSEGILIYDYIPHFSYIVKLEKKRREKLLENLRKNEDVRYVGPFHPGYKILKFTEGDFEREFNLLIFEDADVDEVEKKVREINIKVVDKSYEFVKKLIVSATPSEVQKVIFIPEIQFIEERPKNKPLNEVIRWALQTGVTNDTFIWGKGIRGENQLIGFMDTGLDYYDCFFWDPQGDPPGNNHRKVQAYQNFGSGDGRPNGSYDHGTHVGGTIAGKVDQSDNTQDPTDKDYNGIAKDARLVIQDVFNGTSFNYGANLTTPFQSARNLGVRIHSNSWGECGDPNCNTPNNSYSTAAREVDQFMWNNRDFLIVFAAGNEGPQANTVTAPSVAKNCISVGALRHNNISQIAGYSSRGWAFDNRIKPDVCGIGGAGTGTDYVHSAWNDPTPHSYCDILGMVGTSMATPSVAGAIALIRQYFTEGWYPSGTKNPANSFTPSATLLKAMTISSTNFLATNVYDQDFGWGRVNLRNVLYFSGDAKDLRIAEKAIYATGDSLVYALNVLSSSIPLKIVLVWLDAPAAVNANPALVNNIDLKVRDPNSVLYRGNVFSGGQSTTGGSHDNRNTVELFYRTAPTPGVYYISVIGRNIPVPSAQGVPFALVITGDLGALMGEEESYFVGIPLTDRIILRAKGIYKNGNVVLKRDGNVIYSGKSVDGNFEYVDNDVKSNREYSYELISTSLAGEKRYFGPIKVKFRGFNFDIKVKRNVISNELNLILLNPEKGKINISLFDLSGREHKIIENKEIERGVYSFFIPLDKYEIKQGNYILLVRKDKEEIKKKVVVLSK